VLAREEGAGKGTSTEVMGWDIWGWDPTGKSGSDREVVQKTRTEAEGSSGDVQERHRSSPM